MKQSESFTFLNFLNTIFREFTSVVLGKRTFKSFVIAANRTVSLLDNGCEIFTRSNYEKASKTTLQISNKIKGGKFSKKDKSF